MRNKNYIVFLLVLLALSACTAVDVKPVDISHNINHVCIENNPRVLVTEFVPAVEEVFRTHSITTEAYHGNSPTRCEFVLTYTALRSWDFTPYLSHAELRLFKGEQQIGYAEYHLNAGGGLSLNKWGSVSSKITPVVAKLLEQYQ